MSKSIYEMIREKFPEAEIDNHCSDLYVEAVPGLVDFLRAQGCRYIKFISSKGIGKLMVDIPFAYDPYWKSKEKKAPSNTCPNCGGKIMGDGLTEVLHCENVDISSNLDVEPDAGVLLCGFEEENRNVK